MSHVKNYYNRSFFHEAIQKIKVARFFMDHGVKPVDQLTHRATAVQTHDVLTDDVNIIRCRYDKSVLH